MCNESKLNEIKQHVRKASEEVLGDKLDKVILYGSYARGDNDDGSDIDFLILADISPETAWGERMKISALTGWIDLEYDVLVSLHVTCCENFYKYSNHLPFYINVLKEGVVVNV